MPLRASFAMVFLLTLSQICFGLQPASGSTAAISGLRGPVQSVLTETFNYKDNGEKTPGVSERTIYDHRGYETELYEYGFRRGILRSHTVYTRNGSHLVKTETTNAVSKQKSVQIFNGDGAVTQTDTYDSNGVLTAKTANDAVVRAEKPSVSITKSTDGSISTIERFADGSSKERTVKPDGITVVHFHSQDVDWRQVTDTNNRPLEYIEEPSRGKYMKISIRYDKAGRETETAMYDRCEKLLGETTFQYSQDDENGNWTEQQIWVRTDSKAQLRQVTHRTITYYPQEDK